MTESQQKKYNIICLSNQLWDYFGWTNKHHVAVRLAKLGHNVLFVDPPINMGRLLLKQILRRNWPVSRLLTQQKKVHLENSSCTLDVYSPLNLFPIQKMTSSPLFSLCSKVNAYLHSKRLMSLAKKYFDPSLPTILWVYHVEIPEIKTYLQNLKYDVLIYDCFDNYEGFPAYDTQQKKNWIKSQEEYLSKKADVVFATAPGLVDKLKKFNKNVFYTPNVGDFDKFKDVKMQTNGLPDDISNISKPRVGFTGSLDEYKFDTKLFKKIVSDHPKFSFVLIGQIALKDKEASLREIGIEGFENVYFLGSRPYGQIQKYFAGFDAYIIPYKLNDYTVGGCFPVKFHDALAAGLPVVVTNLPAYAPFKDVCYISRSYAEFSKNIQRALEEDSDKRVKERQKTAKENNWDGKVNTMLNLINYAFESKPGVK